MRWVTRFVVVGVLAAVSYVGLVVAANNGIDVLGPSLLPDNPWIPPLPNQTACQKTAKFQAALADFDKAHLLMARSDYPRANAILDTSISELGYQYTSFLTMDDTGLYLGDAEFELKQGHIKAAVIEKCRTLWDRLYMCGSILRRNKVYHLGPLPSRC